MVPSGFPEGCSWACSRSLAFHVILFKLYITGNMARTAGPFMWKYTFLWLTDDYDFLIVVISSGFLIIFSWLWFSYDYDFLWFSVILSGKCLGLEAAPIDI